MTFDAIDADVIVRRHVHFQIGGEIHVGGVDFQAEPAPAVFGGLSAPPAGATDLTGARKKND